MALFLAQTFAQDSVTIADTNQYSIEKPEDVGEENVPVGTEADNAQSERLLIKSGSEIEQQHKKTLSYLSLLLPGLGEYQIGQRKLGKSLMVADGLMWVGLGVAAIMQGFVKDELRAYLYTYGDCRGDKSSAGRSAWDLNDNELKLPMLVDSSAFYEQRIYKPSRDETMLKINFYWQWDSEAHHQTYYDLFKTMNTIKVAGYYFLGASVVMRVGSFIHARYVVRNAGLSGVQKVSLNVYPGLASSVPTLNVRTSF